MKPFGIRLGSVALLLALCCVNFALANEFADNVTDDTLLNSGENINGAFNVDTTVWDGQEVTGAVITFTFTDESDPTVYLSTTSSTSLNTNTVNGVRTSTRTTTITNTYEDTEVEQVEVNVGLSYASGETSGGQTTTLVSTETVGPTPVPADQCTNTFGFFTSCQNVSVTNTYDRVVGNTGSFQLRVELDSTLLNNLVTSGSVDFSVAATMGDLIFKSAVMVVEAVTPPPPIAYSTFSVEQVTGLAQAKSLNDFGHVGGQISAAQTNDGWSHAALWENGEVTDLGMVGCRETVSHCWSLVYGINNAGQMVGESHTADSWPSPYPWPWGVYYNHEAIWQDKTSAPHLMRTLGWEYGTSLDINESGHVAGHSRSTDWTRVSGDYIVHGFVWRSDEDVTQIGEYGQYSKAFAINDVDQVTGEIDSGGARVAFLWDNGAMTELGHLGGMSSAGTDINNNATPQIVGYSLTDSGQQHAFSWKDGVMVDLGTLPDETGSKASAVNDEGLVVGTSGNRAVIWQYGRIVDLNNLIDPDLGITLKEALDINYLGQVLVKSTNNQYFILTPELSPEADVTVCPVGCDFDSIQAGLNNAANGNTVLVLYGTYKEAVTVSGSKILKSWKGPQATVIDAEGLGTSAVTVQGGTIDGFTIRGGAARYGAGVYVRYGTVTNNIISDNVAETYGGGAFVNSYSSGILRGNTFKNNSAIYGGAIGYSGYSTIVIEGNTMEGNSATYGGAVFFSAYANETFKSNIVVGNTATYGGGLYIPGYTGVQVINSVVANNSATYGGGIVATSYSGAQILNSTVAYNIADNVGGISVYGYAYTKVTNTIIWGNSGIQITRPRYGGPTIKYSLVEGGTVGVGNLDADPLFVNAGGGNFQLLSGSPAIDTGSDTSADGVADDLEGTLRPQDGDGLGAGGTGDGSDFDMGAYEL